MKTMQPAVDQNHKISPLLVMFSVHAVQFGVGALSFQRLIVQTAGNDAWMSVLFAGVAVHLIIAMMYYMLNKSGSDIFIMQRQLTGQWIGGLLSLVWIVYFFCLGTNVIRSFIEIVQVWMFSEISVFWLCALFLLLVYYATTGGFRTVVGVCFLGIVIPLYLIFTFSFPLEYAEYRNILPIWNHSAKDMLLSTKEMAFSYLGFMTLLAYYPFVDQVRKSQKWAHLGNALTILLYTLLILLALVYFSEEQLVRSSWATLTMWKIVEYPFVERFEYIGISSWVLVILPNACLCFWASSRGIRQLFGLQQKKALLVLTVLALAVNLLLRNRQQIDLFTQLTSQAGLYLAGGYIPLLFVISLFLKRRNG